MLFQRENLNYARFPLHKNMPQTTEIFAWGQEGGTPSFQVFCKHLCFCGQFFACHFFTIFRQGLLENNTVTESIKAEFAYSNYAYCTLGMKNLYNRQRLKDLNGRTLASTCHLIHF